MKKPIVVADARCPSRGRRCAPYFLAVVVVLAGCASRGDIAAAIDGINREFQGEYERILAEQGTRRFATGRDQAFDAARAAMIKFGMQVTDQDRALGYLSMRGPAPRPLDLQEWRTAEAADLPKAREIIRKHLGPILASGFTFEPEGLDIVMNVTVIDARPGTEISLTMRMRETAPPKSDLPRREYPPPTAVRMGLEKIWRELGQTLPAARPR
jgi:hypothetical protein